VTLLDDRPLDEPVEVDPGIVARPRPGDARRLAEVALVLARNGVVTVATRPGGLVLRPRRQAPKSLAVALRRSFVELGPTMVKFGQLMASSPGLFPEVVSDEMRRLLDAVPAEPAHKVRSIVERELGLPIEVLFASFDDRPLAAASIAQVHRATLHDGTDVVVKVRRPHLRRRIEQDLRILRTVAVVLSRAGAIGASVNPVALVEDLAASLRGELDFRLEAESMVEFATNLRSSGRHGGIVVPDPIEAMVSERVLVMTYVAGTPVDDGAVLEASGHDLEEIVRSAIRAWMEAALVHGLFHGDVHAGNLLVTPEGKVAFLDFGIAGRLDDRSRRVLRRALPSVLIDGDFGAVVKGVFALGGAPEANGGEPVDVDEAIAQVRSVLAPLAEQSLAEISYGAVLGEVLRVGMAFKVRMPRELVLITKQILYFERYAKELTPDYRLLADPFIVESVIEPRTDIAAPVLTPRPVTRELDQPGGGLIVPRGGDVRFSWVYDGDRHDLTKLYSKAKRSQWNGSTDLDWSTDVDPLDTGGLVNYLPMNSSEAFSRFTDAERAHAAWHFNAWITSQFMHGEQGALLATAKLVEQVPWTESKFYGASQVIDEARHVEVYSRYLLEKLELTYPVNDNLRQLLEIIVADHRWDVTYLGMQIIVEGVALAAFGLIHQFTTEPLMKQLTRYVMADEARHVAFGALSLAGVYSEMSDAERKEREDFVVEAAWLLRDRFLATEVWETLGIPLDDGLRDSSNTPMLQLFQRVLFAKITPNLRKIGLLSDRLAGRLVAAGAMAPDDLAS
jgi:ubiquinone biosynthesis protein